MILAWTGAVLVMAGALACYAAAPHQKLLARPGRSRAPVGALLLVLGTALLLQWAGPATALFIACTLAMLVWSVVPLAAAWARRPRSSP
ncbi:hypothetical protein LK533_14870 [Sphingomonas sp. PL-96]|uniref:hypothetical protein n=1 Tax=Sphingomonas sp. PL-96 TaxID=2887201 RepID=UPI001E4793B2|nr:hypothetical protein [Sphingomonas sp. PL-96]MCC2977951.1 hypothetical protein [Sphingomonas sp. PL-96]